MTKFILFTLVVLAGIQAQAESCRSNLGRIGEGEIRFGYTREFVQDENECIQDFVGCQFGQLTKADLFRECKVIGPGVCVSGTTMTVHEGRASCLYRQATCINGQWEYSTEVDCRTSPIYDLDPFN